MDTIPCFHCHGEGEILAYINAIPQCYWTWIRCNTCDGIGTVSQAQQTAWAEGRQRRARRVAAQLSQREMAARLGTTPQRYSRMEQGLEPWPDDSGAAFAALEE